MAIPTASFHAYSHENKNRKTIGRSDDLQLSSQKLFMKSNEIS
jgi:hypothetical protein